LAEKLILHGQASYTEATSAFSDLYLDDSSLPKIPPGFNYADISELGDFSRLRTKWWHVEGGLKQLLGESYALEYNVTYDDYDDAQPFLVNTSGSKLGLMFRFNWLF
jgi:hypothetical protein